MTTATATPTSGKAGKATRGRGSRATPTPGKTDGDRQAVRTSRSLGKSFLAIEKVEEEIRDTRKLWKGVIGACEAAFHQEIKSDDDGTPEVACRKLKGIVTTFQALEEAEAGRKNQMSLLLAARKEAQGKLKKQVEGASQLGLFDNI